MKNRNLPLKIAAVCFLLSFGQANAQDFKTIIKNHISAKSDFMKSDLKNFEIINEDFSTSMKGDVVKIQQSYNGIPVHNAIGTALIKSEKVTYYNDTFAKNYAIASKPSAAVGNTSIFAKVAQTLDLKNAGQYKLIGIKDAEKDGDSNVKNRLIYFQTENNDLKLCYEFVFEEKGTSNYWLILADAAAGDILSKSNLTLSCEFSHDSFSHHYAEHLPAGFSHNFSNDANSLMGPAALAPLNASYRVYAFPVESPNHGERSLVKNPWFSDASPDGWHTISGNVAPGSFTTTKGNNVFAYEDRKSLNIDGDFADGGPSRVFDFPILEDNATFNLNASITNLFYVNNKVHDIFYRLGFTETARNFQAYNFGKGGAQNDYVRAEAQDGGGRNNANFYTPSDGSKPRMQMYLFDGKIVDRVYYNTPAEAVGRLVPNYVSTTFGPTLTLTGVTGDVKMVDDIDGCTDLPAGSLAGKIGLIERGTCGFSVKVKNAQNAGALAAIIYNLPNSSPTAGMAGEDATITIPSVLVENNEGVYIKNLLTTENVNITLKYDAVNQKTKDGSLDNGIVIHEYGHGISNRLTGDGYSCLSTTYTKEQMGEGWSDFFALMLTNQPGDNKDVARGIGTFASSELISGGGIRPAKYSPDFAINNFTYGKTNGMGTNTAPTVHSIGFVWATMLWDLHWKYAEKYGYSSDVMANSTNGSTKVLQLVTDGLKLQACSPTFIDGRNAILAADLASGGTDKCMIWETFANRGLGVNASAGLKTNINDQVEDFDIPGECKGLSTSNTAINKVMSIYPNPAKDEFFIKSSSNVLGKVNVQIYDAAGKLVSSQKIASSDAVNTQTLPNGVYIVKVEGLGINYSSKLMIKK
ncbi:MULTISPECIES: T9SS-dependent M36 family metallopeptidase [unclassified Kaistella]|uniref:T9SS-dependent M36 family metallopeptidase n=1 Tax=unclassified Kaistella TaxID=2762626 RepID=UPI0027368C1B|nr:MULTISPECIES: T9SS-dependent M36 family metallopeptidase [unclassified Kaistella]MDP2454750.1 T9SS-dependent M36 family metallopeptidase [Kaistella sp. SH11-4b]MDP2457487.1 T9SS-dependent M36 family metallopeptidase [Kaistella sp. SH40-3]MDP2460247.1 T9SS-dependent M36 family metallopeptidase [Kaistella sp. SH19-2b]